MILQIVAATLGDDIEVVATEWPQLLGADEGAVERIVGVVHLIHAEHCLEAVLVERLVVGHKRESLYHGFYLSPHLGEDGSVLSVFPAQTVDAGAFVVVVVGFGMDELVELVHHLSSTNNHHAN